MDDEYQDITQDPLYKRALLEYPNRLKCEGNCESHTKIIRKVRVWSRYKDWGIFTYCQNAIEEDESRGLEVEILTE